MRLFLDDVREPSFIDWAGNDIVVCRTATEAIETLKAGGITEASLDHDLGGMLIEEGRDGLSGYAVACWIEEQAYTGNLKQFVVKSHSQNPNGRDRIEAAIQSAERFWSK